ncbi:hypothetical protein BU23DRAFT_304975 [Bimuria novae-zelandiae CBS 107.79]|uniref:Uncharacterized protein n=1 Tax=Bimuria novae-zelandiae CBS 107.79 TaxID=1447943 RepID=A0A6A5UVW7_9PLEO|nr:hypothetical protein BU23DRAFT_304975 [Bimuria novae-zelandiae CBS 107.79]
MDEDTWNVKRRLSYTTDGDVQILHQQIYGAAATLRANLVAGSISLAHKTPSIESQHASARRQNVRPPPLSAFCSAVLHASIVGVARTITVQPSMSYRRRKRLAAVQHNEPLPWRPNTFHLTGPFGVLLHDSHLFPAQHRENCLRTISMLTVAQSHFCARTPALVPIYPAWRRRFRSRFQRCGKAGVDGALKAPCSFVPS